MYDYDGPDTEENPLLAELEIVLAARGSAPNFIAVDDARGMGIQPGWPPFVDTLSLLQDHGYSTVCIDDTMIAVPKSLDPDFYALYKLSRTVEVSALFHIWPKVTRGVRRRAASDSVISSVRDKLRLS